MFDLFSAGGVFMTPLTVLGIGALLLASKKISDVYVNAEEPASKHRATVNAVLQLGILSFFLGVLSQAIGLIQAFQAIEQMGAVSPQMLAGGLKVSMIASVYGLLILIITFIAWSALKHRLDAMEAA